jgi:hypothetical protein
MDWMGRHMCQKSTMPPIDPIKICRSHIIWPQLWEQKPGWNLQQVWSDRFICLFPLCPLCECLPLAGIPSTPAPNFILQHCYTTIIMLISWSRGRSGQLQKCTFYLSKWVQITHRAPHSLPECLNFQQMSRFRYNIKYLAFRWGIRGFELGGELSETGRVGFSQGRPAFVSQILFIVLPLSFAGKSLKLEIGD